MTKILMVHPDFSRLGGIENYLLKILPHLQLAHESSGNSRRPGERGLLARARRILGDYLSYFRKVSHSDISIVHLNPSLQPRMFYRDFIYLWIAKIFRKKTLVFFHGWDTRFKQGLDKNHGRIFRLLYGPADAFVVLASSFAQSLRDWGVTQPIFQEVIVIEDEVFASIDIEELLRRRQLATTRQMLFPARLIRAKGIFTVIEALRLVQKKYPQCGLVVAGDGEDAEAARQQVARLKLDHVRFTGIVSGNEKYDLFRQASLLCFPTEHPEGFPNTIVEAMAFGLPVITRPVGGIADFFIDGENGYISDSTDAGTFARMIEKTLAETRVYPRIARANHRYAADHFLASQAAKRLEDIYLSL